VTSRPTCGSGDEDWEAEANVKVSYNPAEAAARKNVVRKIEGVVPSQRKAFRMREVERLREMERKAETSDSSSSDNEDEKTPDSNVFRNKGKGVLLAKLRKLRISTPDCSQGPSVSVTAKNNNTMKRRGVDQNLECSEFAPVSAKRPVSKGRGRIKWQTKA